MNNKCNALVTASTKGIGFQAALSLAEKGCNVVINARNYDEIKEAKKKLKRGRNKVYGIKGDLSKKNEIDKILDKALQKLGSIDVVVMNYGNPKCEPCNLVDADYNDWLYAFNMYIYSTAEAMNYLYKHNERKVNFIIISSFSIYSPMQSTALSDIIRISLLSLVKTYSKYYSDKIRANALLLGSFKTEGAENLIKKLSSNMGIDEQDFWDKYVKSLSPLNRLGRFEELRDVISFLAFSPEYLMGSLLLFDGGSLNCII
ncbi:SDR family oxidoreductase [Caldisphaera lagunensis]|nr:SDR family oxidoreductase [Caldisphaera lagunensis]